ncbi:cation efflux family protein, partial [Ostertagia ostertagi]
VWDTRLTVITIVLNVALIFAKITAAILSDSLSIIASVVDSAMDITSGLVLWYTCRLIERSNKHHYPVDPVPTGRPCRNCFRSLSSAQTAIKAVLYIICRTRNTSASRILAIDQRNDCFTNIVALAGAYIGHQWWKYADPIGAAIRTLIIVTWLFTVKEQVPLLIGKSASPQLINRIINVAISHDERIKHLDTVYVYHFGANFLVELHVVMDREINLCEAHDVSETLQLKLEQLSFR